jgi:HEPN domain-containing protein
MNESLEQYIGQWLFKANEDLKVVERLMDDDSPMTNPICFHCQQAVEKFLKAFLCFKEVETPKTHDVVLLRKLCTQLVPHFADLDIKDLNRFAVQSRYPDTFYLPSIKEARKYIDLAREVRKLVESQIQL